MADVDTLIVGATVVTQNADREILPDGAVALTGSEITAVGPTSELRETYTADTVIDATGRTVLPGFVNGHVHVADLLLRGSFRADRGLYDWLYNVKRPGVGVMDTDDHATAAALYCYESITAGVTTFVENHGELPWNRKGDRIIESKLEVYDRAGLRTIYGRGMLDAEPTGEFLELIERVQAREPDVAHQPAGKFAADTDTVLSSVESLIEDYHGSADGRQSIWPAPVVIEGNTPACLQGAAALAKTHDVMSTIHVAEAEFQASGPISGVEYLRNLECLGSNALLAHCVQVDERDIRLLGESGTRVAHNLVSNLRLGVGIAPLRRLRDAGVTTCLGTDNAILGDTINPLSDIGVLGSAHSGNLRDPGVITPQVALDMVTVEAGRAIGRPDLGTLEPGTAADLILLDLEKPHLTPAPDVLTALVHGTLGTEVETVICNGDLVMEDGDVLTLGPFDSLRADATERAAAICERAGISR